MAAAIVELKGDKELMQALERLKKSDRSKVLRKGMRTAAKTLKDAAAARVPVRTGKLKRSLKVRAAKRSRTGPGIMVVCEGADAAAERKAGKKKSDAQFQGDVFYGAFVELGTSRMPAQPFLRPAFDANVERIETQFRRDVQTMAEEIWRRKAG